MSKAFLFDMDGLLLDTERVYRDAFFDVTSLLGCAKASDRVFFDGLVGSSSAYTEVALRAYLPESVGLGPFMSEWYAACDRRLAGGVPVKPTVRGVLQNLHDQGAVMAVVTSSASAHAHDHLDRAGLLAFFHCVTGGDAVSANKPDPAPYVETAQKVGFAPSDCFAFEDSDRGITAAVRAGCTSFQIPDLRPPAQPLPALGQYVAKDLLSAMRVLNALTGKALV